MAHFLHFIRRYMVPYRWWYLGGTVALFLTNWMAVTIPIYVAEAIDALGVNDVDVVRSSAISVAWMGAAIIIARSASRVLFFTPGRFAEARVKIDLFDRVLEQQPAFVSQFPPGDLVSRSSSDVTNLRLLAGFGALNIVNVTVILALTLTQMARLSPQLTVWTVIPLAVGLVITRFFIRWLFVLVKRIQRQTAKLSDYIVSSYQSVATIQGFGAETAFIERFQVDNVALQNTLLQRTALRTVISPILAFSTGVSVFLILYYGGAMTVVGGSGEAASLTTGELVAFIALVALLAGPLRGLSFLLAIVKQAEASMERLNDVIGPAPDRPDLPEPAPVREESPGISIRNMTFSYPDAERPALVDVSVEIPASHTLGVFGPTGAGKTTLLQCIARLYNPPGDSIFVDGVDLRRLDLGRWREQSVLVPQRPFLFSESVWDTISLGVYERERADDVISLTSLRPDIASFSDGLDTEVGESGVMLSGGQRQRIALARGLIRTPTLLMLDDVLSAVDHRTEKELIATLRSSGERPTTIIVAHRISALQHADHIVVLEEGRAVAQGTHDELIHRDGIYRESWRKQQEVSDDDS